MWKPWPTIADILAERNYIHTRMGWNPTTLSLNMSTLLSITKDDPVAQKYFNKEEGIVPETIADLEVQVMDMPDKCFVVW